MPDVWLKKPKIPTNHEWIYQAYWEVATERPQSMGGLPFIPITKIFEYCKWREIEGNTRDLFVSVIHSMDTVFVNYCNARENKSQLKKQNKKV